MKTGSRTEPAGPTPSAPPAPRPRPSGLVGHRDRAQRTHFGLASRFGVSHLTADALLDCWQRQQALSRCQPGFVLLSLMFDGVVDCDDLERAWPMLASAYRCVDGAGLEWRDRAGRQQRRLLGPVTRLALAACPRPRAFDAASKQLVVALTSPGKFEPDLADIVSIVRARMATALPGDLLAHVIGDHPLNAVPRTCLARLETRQAILADRASRNQADASPGDGVRWRVADAIFSPAQAMEPDETTSLLRAIAGACRAESGELNPALDRRRMAAELEALAPACVAAGGWLCVLWSWTVDLVGRGTNRTRPLSPHSIDPYVTLTLVELHGRVCGHRLSDAPAVDWEDLYAGIELAPSILPSQRGKAAAALTAWHEFLVEHLGVLALERPIDAEGQATVPKANIVWPHEQAWMLCQLVERAANGRFDEQLATVAAVACSAAIRSQDLWHIHLFGVHVAPNVVALNIDPLPSAGQGKSRNARRVIEVTGEPATGLLRKWLGRRLAEGGLPADFLFGEPCDPGVACSRGSTEALLNVWLKAATGDGSVSIHTLRHSHISLKRQGSEQRSFDEASAQAGHGSTQMSVDHYCHRYEPDLRQALDTWQRSRTLTEAQVCELTGKRPGFLRQRWRRHRQAHRLDLAWEAIDEAANLLPLPSVAEGIALAEPRPVPEQSALALSVGNVLAWLTDLCSDVPVEVVRLRHGIEADNWHAFEATVRAWQVRCGRRNSVRGARAALSGPTVPFTSGFRHLGQPKLRRLVAAIRATTGAEALLPVVQSWLDCLRGNYLAIDDTIDMLPLLKWLGGAGVGGGQIVVCHDSVVDAGVVAEASDTVELVLGAAPAIRLESQRAGRPRVYLMLRSMQDAPGASANAANSVQGLQALLFTAWVWLQMRARGHGDG